MEINGKNPAKSLTISLPGDNALFVALIITDVLAPFFIWPHWTGRFYLGWLDFFNSGLAHWLQALALLLAWPVLRKKLWGRIGLVLAAAAHLFWPPPALDDQLISGLAATMAWWLAALPAVLAAGGELPEGPAKSTADTGSRRFKIITWLALLANLILILVIVRSFLLDPGGLSPNVGLAALQEMGIFLVFLSALLLAGRRRRLFNAPIYLAALISLGGICWLWPGPGLTESEMDAFLTGLLAIHITLMPALGAVAVALALVSLVRHRYPEGLRCPSPLFQSGRLLALALIPLAGLGLAAIPLWADHLSRSYLDPPPPASEPFALMAAGPLHLPLPASLEVGNWLTFINWADDEEEGPEVGSIPGPPNSDWPPRGREWERPGPWWREVHGMALVETEYANPSRAGHEFEEAWQGLLSRAADRPGHPKTAEDPGERFGRPSRLLIHYYPPRSGGQEGRMIMRLTFLQQQAGGYIRVVESAQLETLGIDPVEIDRLKADKRDIFLRRVEEMAAAYRWGQWADKAGSGAMFMTRFGRLDHSRLRAELEAVLRLSRADESAYSRRRSRDGTNIWIRKAAPPDSDSRLVPTDGPEAAASPGDSSSPQASERLDPLLGWIKVDRASSAAGRSGLERIRITTSGLDNGPASLNATWNSFDGGLEVEIWSDRRLVQSELPTLTRLWSGLLAGPDQ
jgi:hypothetical protein